MAVKRICITDELAIKRINLIAVSEGLDPSELLTEAVSMLWAERGEAAIADINKLSPVSAHLPKGEDG